MAHFGDNKDANLVVAAVLLIEVMVLVSVAVDACTGKSSRVSQVEELTIYSFTVSSENAINVIVENNGKISFETAEI